MKREPIFNVPAVVLGLIIVMIAVQAVMDWLDADTASELIMAYGFIPADVSERLSGGVLHHLMDLAADKPDDMALTGSSELAEYLLNQPSALPLSFISYAFLHAGWASGAVSGIMAAAIRFVFQPGESLSGFSLNAAGSYRAPALPLVQTFRDRRTLRFIILWLAINIATGLAGVPLGLTEGSIAWEAHLGGFLIGLLTFSLIDPPLQTIDGRA